MSSLAVLDVAGQRRNLPVGVELDAVRRVEIDALDLAPQRLALGEARHDGERVAEDETVRPMLVVLIELSARFRVVEAVEIREEVRRVARLLLRRSGRR